MSQMSYPLDDNLYTASYPQLWLSTRTNGVFSSDNDLTCTAVEGMRVEVSPGIAWLSPGRFMGAVYGNTDTVSFTLPIADGLLNRIDRIALRWDYVENNITLTVKQGELSSSPLPPALQRDTEAFELGLYDILIRAGTVNLTQANISDLRMNEELCGIMRDGVTGIPTQALYLQWDSWFSGLKSGAEADAEGFTEWLTLFRSQSETEFSQWFSNFTSASNTTFWSWYNAFKSNSENDFNAWFADLQNTLDENQASMLFNKIDQHQRLTLEDGVHGIRIQDNIVQLFVRGGWANTNIVVMAGLRVGYINNLMRTCGEINAKQLTCGEINNLVEKEAI